MANVAAAERHVQQEYKPREKQIIQSTLSCLMELGWERTTFEEISRRAGTPRGSIFYYFKTRENLMIEVLNNLIASFFMRVDKAVIQDDGAWNRLIAVMKLHFGEEIWRQERIAVWQMFRVQGLNNEAIQEILKDLDRQYLEHLNALIGASAEELGCSDIDVEHLSLTVFALVEGMRGDFLTTPKRFDRKSAEKLCLRYLADVFPTAPAPA